MPCDLQTLLASAADLPATLLPRGLSAGERMIEEAQRLAGAMQQDRHQYRAARLGLPVNTSPATLAAFEAFRG